LAAAHDHPEIEKRQRIGCQLRFCVVDCGQSIIQFSVSSIGCSGFVLGMSA